MDIWIIFWTVLVGFFVFNWLRFRRRVAYFEENNIPFKKPWWLVGNMWGPLLGMKFLYKTVDEVYKLSPKAKYVGFFDFQDPVVIIKDLELMKQIAVKNWESFPHHRGFIANDELDPLFGLNLFSLKGKKWHDIRTMLSPAFTSSKMKTMFQLTQDCASNFADFLTEQAKQGKTEVEMKEVFARYTNDVIATCAFGLKIDSMRDRNNDFYILGKKATNFDGILSFKFFLLRSFPRLANMIGARLIGEKITNFFIKTIKETIETRDKEQITRPDMLQLMMDVRGKTNELDLISMTAQAFIFFFGGFDTTSTTMSFLAYNIATNPEVHKKLQAEVDEVWDRTKGQLNYENLQNMHYLDAVVNEVLRMYPPALFTDRVCTKDFELPPALPGNKPYTIKSGESIWFPIYSFSYDPQYFSNPTKFDPERFYQKEVTVNHNAYIPFGIGPRVCIGNRFALQEIKIVLFHLLVRCNLKASAKTHIPMKFSKSSFVLLSEGGFWLQLEPRKKYVSFPFPNIHKDGSMTA